MGNEVDAGPRDICERTLAYAVRIVRLFRSLEHSGDGACRVIGKQLLRAGTSIGANVAEAQSAESTADFVHKLSIAQKEARESAYWLLLLEASEALTAKQLGPIRNETNELIAIVTSIIVTTKAKNANEGVT